MATEYPPPYSVEEGGVLSLLKYESDLTGQLYFLQLQIENDIFISNP
jgi:hypothetical protein